MRIKPPFRIERDPRTHEELSDAGYSVRQLLMLDRPKIVWLWGLGAIRAGTFLERAFGADTSPAPIDAAPVGVDLNQRRSGRIFMLRRKNGHENLAID